MVPLYFILILGSDAEPAAEPTTPTEDENSVGTLMDMSLEDLLNLEINTAGKVDEPVSEIPASVVILTRRDIAKFGYQTVTEILEHVAGFYKIDDYSGSEGAFGVRGFWSAESNSHIAILVNRIPQYHSRLFVPVSAIDRVEIIRGPMAVVYGNNSVFGLINIVTNSNDSGNYLISGSYGNFNSYGLFARASGQERELKFTVNVAMEGDDGVDVKYRDMMYPDDYEQLQNAEKLVFHTDLADDHSTKSRLERNGKYLDLSANYRDLYLNVMYKDNQYEAFYMYPALMQGTDKHHVNSDFLIGYKKDLLEILSIDFKLNYQHLSGSTNYDLGTRPYWGKYWVENDTVDGELDTVVKPLADLDIVLGLNYNAIVNWVEVEDHATIIPDLENWESRVKPNDHIGQAAVFTQINYKPFESLKLVGGLRLERSGTYTIVNTFRGGLEGGRVYDVEIESPGVLLIPRLAGIWSINSNNIVKLLYGQATKRPYPDKLDVVLAALQNEKASTLEFNYLLTFKNFTGSLNVFWNSLNNLVRSFEYFDLGALSYTIMFDNSGRMNTIGCELMINTSLFDHMTVELDLTYQHTMDEGTKNEHGESVEVGYSPAFTAHGKIAYQVPIPKVATASLGLTATFVDSMKASFVPANAQFGIPEGRTGDDSYRYYLLGLNLRLEKILDSGAFLNVRFSNLLNATYRYPTSLNNYLLTRGTLGRGFFVYATIGLAL